MSKRTVFCAASIIKRGNIRAIDVACLREAFPRDARTTAEDAELLFSIEDACPVRDASWAAFYIDVISEHFVLGIEPSGYMTEAKAERLMSRLAGNGHGASRTGVELLVAVIEKARWSPPSLVRFALAEVERAVVQGAGPFRAGNRLSQGMIAKGEIDILRRVLCGFGGDARLPITRPEAEALFAIDEAIIDMQPEDAWTDLFVKTIANALFASSGYAVPSRREALRREPWPGLWQVVWPGASIAQNAAWSFGRLTEKYRKQAPDERALARLERQRLEIITGEAIEFPGVRWLAERLERERPTVSIGVLLDYLREARLDLHPLLHDLMDERAQAA